MRVSERSNHSTKLCTNTQRCARGIIYTQRDSRLLRNRTKGSGKRRRSWPGRFWTPSLISWSINRRSSFGKCEVANWAKLPTRGRYVRRTLICALCDPLYHQLVWHCLESPSYFGFAVTWPIQFSDHCWISLEREYKINKTKWKDEEDEIISNWLVVVEMIKATIYPINHIEKSCTTMCSTISGPKTLVMTYDMVEK